MQWLKQCHWKWQLFGLIQNGGEEMNFVMNCLSLKRYLVYNRKQTIPTSGHCAKGEEINQTVASTTDEMSSFIFKSSAVSLGWIKLKESSLRNMNG